MAEVGFETKSFDANAYALAPWKDRLDQRVDGRWMTYLYYALPFIVCVHVAVCAWAGAHNAPKCEPCLVSKPTEQQSFMQPLDNFRELRNWERERV